MGVGEQEEPGWGSRRSRGGCRIGSHRPSPPASSCPPTAPGAALTPSWPGGCVGTLLLASARSQGQHYRKLLEPSGMFQDLPTLGRAFPLGLGFGKRVNAEIKGPSGAAGGARRPRTRSRNCFLEDPAGRGPRERVPSAFAVCARGLRASPGEAELLAPCRPRGGGEGGCCGLVSSGDLTHPRLRGIYSF